MFQKSLLFKASDFGLFLKCFLDFVNFPTYLKGKHWEIFKNDCVVIFFTLSFFPKKKLNLAL
jgi:hypothetical protein